MTENEDAAADKAAASLSCSPPALLTLAKRAEFLACARAQKAPAKGFVLQARDRRNGTSDIRVGFTASKKVGNAVARNRAKRRLRALAREILPEFGHPGWDYVLIGRAEATASLPFETLRADLIRSLARIHQPK